VIIIKTLIVQLKSRKLLTSSLIFALTVTLIFLSSLYSSIIYNQQIFEIQNNNYSPEQMINYFINPNNLNNYKTYKIDRDSFMELCSKADIRVDFGYSFGNVINKVQIYYSKTKEPRVALYDDGIIKKAKNNYAYPGIDLRDEFKKYVEISGVKYDLGEAAGVKNKTTTFNDSISIYTKDAEKVFQSLNKVSGDYPIMLNLYNENINNSIKECVGKAFREEYFQVQEVTRKDSKYDAIKAQNSKEMIILIIVGLLSVITISTFWIIDRHKEISIKRAFGARNMHIVFEIYKELLIICIFCGVLSVIINWVIYRFSNIFNSLQVKFSFANILVCIAGIIMISIVTSVLPIYKALREEIISGLRK